MTSTNMPQPAVGTAQGDHPLQNTGSQASVASSGKSFTEGLAGAKTPPAVATPAAGGRAVLPKLMIDQDGALYIGDDDDIARHYFTNPQVEALGDFLRLTEPLWRR